MGSFLVGRSQVLICMSTWSRSPSARSWASPMFNCNTILILGSYCPTVPICKTSIVCRAGSWWWCCTLQEKHRMCSHFYNFWLFPSFHTYHQPHLQPLLEEQTIEQRRFTVGLSRELISISARVTTIPRKDFVIQLAASQSHTALIALKSPVQ